MNLIPLLCTISYVWEIFSVVHGFPLSAVDASVRIARTGDENHLNVNDKDEHYKEAFDDPLLFECPCERRL